MAFLAGIYTNAILFAIFSIISIVLSGYYPGFSQISWLFSIYLLIIIFTTLNPAMKFDGYFALSSALKRPDLQTDALAFLLENSTSYFRKAWQSTPYEFILQLLLGLLVILSTLGFWVDIYKFLSMRFFHKKIGRRRSTLPGVPA